MTLINRISRLFRADLHAVLDRIEEPDLLLHQAVREMEEDLGRDRRRLSLFDEARRALGARLAELEAGLTGLGEELDVCFAADKEDLARTLLRRRLEAERLRDLLVRKREVLDRDMARLQIRIDENATRLEAMRQKEELLTADEPAGTADLPRIEPDLRVRDEDVEVAFLRERRRRAGP
jgi:phage shock protein A